MASFERASLSSARARVSYLPTLNEPYVSFTFADHDQDFSASGLPPLVLSFTATGRPKKPPRLNTHTKDTALNALRAQWLSSYNELFGAEQQKQLVLSRARSGCHVGLVDDRLVPPVGRRHPSGADVDGCRGCMRCVGVRSCRRSHTPKKSSFKVTGPAWS